jgi:hypothetical protein
VGGANAGDGDGDAGWLGIAAAEYECFFGGRKRGERESASEWRVFRGAITMEREESNNERGRGS